MPVLKLVCFDDICLQQKPYTIIHIIMTPNVPTKKERDAMKKVVRDALAVFILAVGGCIGRAYWFTLQGDCEMGLCLLTMLSIEDYARALFLGNFVIVNKRSTGEYYVKGVNKHHVSGIDNFIKHHETPCDQGLDGVAEATVSQSVGRRETSGIVIRKTLARIR